MGKTPVTMKMIEICYNLQQPSTHFRYVAFDGEKDPYGSTDVPTSGRYVDCSKIINHSDDYYVTQAKSALSVYTRAMDNLAKVNVDVVEPQIESQIEPQIEPSVASRTTPTRRNATSPGRTRQSLHYDFDRNRSGRRSRYPDDAALHDDFDRRRSGRRSRYYDDAASSPDE